MVLKMTSPLPWILPLILLLLAPAPVAGQAQEGEPGAPPVLLPWEKPMEKFQDPPRRRRRRGPPPTAPPAPLPEVPKEEEETGVEDRYLAIVGGFIHSIVGPDIVEGTVISKNGRITDIGTALEIPSGAEVIDASGLHVYPGLVTFESRSLIGSGQVESTHDPWGIQTVLGLAAGITSVFNGSVVGKLAHGTLDGVKVRAPAFERISYSSRNPDGRRKLRRALERIREFHRATERYEEKKKTNPDAKEPDSKWIRGEYLQARKLIEGDATALVSANTVHEIREICDLARQFKFRLVIRGAVEGWIDPGIIARSRASVVVTPRARNDRDVTRIAKNGSSIENAKILHQYGVPVAILPQQTRISMGGLAGRDLQHYTMEAAYAVRGGLPERAAIEGLTIVPAQLLGVDDRIGSIEVGKDADFVIVDGDLLHYMTMPRWTVVN
ncbi:MAG TPA: hypothetical protein EYN00_03965, partial [Planctomycetes bacterium]|nr:hypothetical protein [Planctomycetota bacterium]